jgi:hypothetical protein
MLDEKALSLLFQDARNLHRAAMAEAERGDSVLKEALVILPLNAREHIALVRQARELYRAAYRFEVQALDLLGAIHPRPQPSWGILCISAAWLALSGNVSFCFETATSHLEAALDSGGDALTQEVQNALYCMAGLTNPTIFEQQEGTHEPEQSTQY